MSPWVKEDKKTGSNYTLPCGKCPDCLAKRASGWSFRLLQEEKICSSALFLTLTYNTDHVPITNKGYMTLNKTDPQKFMKRLRKLHTTTLKYYTVGEYGGKSKRPHYHLILFNAHEGLISKAWTLGDIHYGKVTGASIGYCLKYMSKPSQIPQHKNDDRLPEFGLFSKGLGKNYLTINMINYHHAKVLDRMYCTLQDGKKISMPRYYKDKIYDENQREQIASHFKNQKNLEYEKTVNHPDYTQLQRDKEQGIIAAYKKQNRNAHKQKI